MSSASYPFVGSSGGVPTYANLAAFPSAAGAGNGSLAIALDTDILYISNGAAWEVLADPTISPLAITQLHGDGSATGPGDVALTLATVNSNVGSFGDASHVAAITVNGKGLTTAAASTAIQIAESQVTNLVSDLAAKQSSTLTNTHLLVGNASNVATDVAASGDLSLANTGAFTFNTVNGNVGSFGDASHVAAITVNAKGLTTAAASTAIQIAESQVTNLVSDLAAKQSSTLTSTHILVGNVSNVATDVAMSGDVTIANNGATTIANLAVTNAKIANTTIDLTTKVTGVLPTANGGTGQNSSATFPTSGVVVTEAASETLTNKTINGSSNTLTVLAGSQLSGQVPIANGGTGQATKAAGFDALSPMSASGDIIYGGASGTGTRLAKGSDTQVLTLASGLPSWANPGGLSSTTGADADTVMTSASASVQIITPTANRTYTLPTTGIAQGQTYYFVNNAAVSSSVLSILINASGGSLMVTLFPTSSVTVVALKATPTAATDWMALGECTSNWHPYTLTIGATTTPPTPGTIGVNEARWRRMGDSMQIYYNFHQTTGGANGTGTYLFPLPSGYTINSSVVTASTDDETAMLGTGFNGVVAGGNSHFVGNMKAYNSSNLIMTTSGSTAPVSSTGDGRLSISDMGLGFIATVPITGWQSNRG